MLDPSDLRGLTAAQKPWSGALHPRGKDGKFIEVGGAVKWMLGGEQRLGDVTDVRPGRDGNAIITVKERNGRVSQLRPEQISTGVKSKATLPGVKAKATLAVSPQAEEAARRVYSPDEGNGFTGRPTERGLTKPTTGYSVGVPGSTLVITPEAAKDRSRMKATIQTWMDQHAAKLEENQHLNFGAWTESETGEVYLDLSEVYDSQSQAEAVAKSRDEIAIWDIANGAPIDTGGTGGRDAVDVVAAGGSNGRNPEATVRVPTGLAPVQPGGEGRLPGGAVEPDRPRSSGVVTATGGPTPDELRLRAHGGSIPMTTPDELRARVHGMTAANRWAEALHPRGRDGRFIEIGSLVRFMVGGKPKTGKVQGIKAHKMKGGADIDVVDADGKEHHVGAGDVLRSVPVKGDLDTPAAAPRGDKVKYDPDNGHVTINGTTVGKVVEQENGDFEVLDVDLKHVTYGDTLDEALDLLADHAGNVDGPKNLRHHSPTVDERVTADRTQFPGGGPTGTGTKDDPIITSDVDVAVQALSDGKYVQLNQADEVATLLDKLAEVANDFKAQGENAKGKFDLCKISVPKTNIFCAQAKVPDRLHMPQLGGVPSPGTDADALPKDKNGEVDLSDQFIEHLAGMGIKVTDTQREASHLRASQGQLDGATVAGMMTNPDYDPGKKPIFVTRDGYVVDGHHRWAAVTGRSYKAGESLPMNVREIDADILDVLAIANDFATNMGMPQRTMGEGGPAKPRPFPSGPVPGYGTPDAPESMDLAARPSTALDDAADRALGGEVAKALGSDNAEWFGTDAGQRRQQLDASDTDEVGAKAAIRTTPRSTDAGTTVNVEDGSEDTFNEWQSAAALSKKVNWGKPYGTAPSYDTPEGPVWMFRKGQKVRFYNAAGDQVGPEQANVAPAVAFALSEEGWAPLIASVSPWKRYTTMLASGAVTPESPFLSSDGQSWNGSPVPDKVRVAITKPMGKVTDTNVASALNAVYQTLVLGNAEVPLDSIIEQVDNLESVAAAEGTDGGDASMLQGVSKLVRTIFAIPDQADLDRAQEKANGKAKSLGGPSAPAEEEAPAEEAPAEAPAEAAPAAQEEPVTGEAGDAPQPAAAPAAPAVDVEALRARVHAS